MKAGYKTTEFWYSTLVSIYAMTLPFPWNMVVSVVSSGLYTIGRTMLKMGDKE